MLTMIALFSYSKGWCQSSSSTGGCDSVLIAYDDLRTANIKMTQLKYANQKINLMDSIIKVDSVELNSLKVNNNKLVKNNKKIKTQRNIIFTTAIGLLGVIIGIIL